MFVKIKLFATFTDFVPRGSDNPFRKEVPESTTVDDIIEELKLPADAPRVTLINGTHATEDAVLKPGDVLYLIPVVFGG